MKVAHLEEIEGHTVGKDGLLWKPLRHTLGVEAFGINAYTAEQAGDEVVEHHDETKLGHQEIYIVVSGHATFHVNDEEIDAPAGTCVSSTIRASEEARSPFNRARWSWRSGASRARRTVSLRGSSTSAPWPRREPVAPRKRERCPRAVSTVSARVQIEVPAAA